MAKKEIKLKKKPENEDKEDESGIEKEERDVVINEAEEAKKLKAFKAKLFSGGDEEKGVQIKASKDISKVKKGDKIKVDGLVLEVDAHYVLIEHSKGVKEMAIEAFDSKTDKDYQIRYFMGRVEDSIEFYELQGGLMYVKKPLSKIEW